MSETSSQTDAEYFAAKKRRIVRLILIYAAFVGFLACFLPEEDGTVEFAIGLPFLFLGISWCYTDANQQGRHIGTMMSLLIVLIFCIGFPLYLLRTRGLRGVQSIILSLGLVGGVFVVAYVSSLLTSIAGQALGFWETDW